jgi:hypothetical protein
MLTRTCLLVCVLLCNLLLFNKQLIGQEDRSTLQCKLSVAVCDVAQVSTASSLQ